MISNLTSLRRTAVQVLAAAAVEQFPGTLLVGGSGSHLGFHYDFTFPFPFQKEFLPLLEERMRAIMKEERQIVLREMVPENAGHFFDHHHQPYIAERARGCEGLVTIFQMEEFYDLASPSFLSHSGEIGAFKLTEAADLGDGVVRVYGTTFSNKQELKGYLKKLNRYEEIDHARVGEQMQLFTEMEEGLWLWLPKGEFIRDSLLKWWRDEHVKQSFQFLKTPEGVSEEAILKTRSLAGRKSAEAFYIKKEITDDELERLFSSRGYTEDLAYIFCGQGELVRECISSLQFITKISKILGFEWQLALCVGPKRQNASWKKGVQSFESALEQTGLHYVLDGETAGGKGPRIEVRVQDGLGRYWPGPYLELNCGQSCLMRSMFGPLERAVALLIEQHNGTLPFWLFKEQVRVLTVSQGAGESAKQIAEQLRSYGLRVNVDEYSEEGLGSRLHKALQEKVPYCIFIGDREMRSAQITVRASGSAKDEQMSLEDLAQKLIRKQEDRF